MGLDDRDYMSERYKDTRRSGQPLIKRPKKNSTGIKYLLYSLITITVLWYGSNNLLIKKGAETLIKSPIVARNIEPIDWVAGGVILHTDRQGHFRGTALVNNIPMPFLIDTGATKTSIPASMAIAAGLPFGSEIQSSTAGGQVIDRQTRINSLKIGNAEIRGLDANINQHLKEILIGMNTLKYFQMTQSGNTLTLTANNQEDNWLPTQDINQLNNRSPTVALESNKFVKKNITVKKTVTCDQVKSCKTTYSDH
jgi:aspartyl protease family protein